MFEPPSWEELARRLDDRIRQTGFVTTNNTSNINPFGNGTFTTTTSGTWQYQTWSGQVVGNAKPGSVVELPDGALKDVVVERLGPAGYQETYKAWMEARKARAPREREGRMELVDARVALGTKEEVAEKLEEYSNVEHPTEYDERVKAAFEEMAKAIELVDSGTKVIDLHATIRRAFLGGSSMARLTPNLAVAPARAMGRRVDYSLDADGSLVFSARVPTGAKGVFAPKEEKLEVTFPPGTNAWARDKYTNHSTIPVIPPRFRSLIGDKTLVLWEVSWARKEPDPDPALLEPIGNGLCTVTAEWDLTAVEAASMNYL